MTCDMKLVLVCLWSWRKFYTAFRVIAHRQVHVFFLGSESQSVSYCNCSLAAIYSIHNYFDDILKFKEHFQEEIFVCCTVPSLTWAKSTLCGRLLYKSVIIIIIITAVPVDPVTQCQWARCHVAVGCQNVQQPSNSDLVPNQGLQAQLKLKIKVDNPEMAQNMGTV